MIEVLFYIFSGLAVISAATILLTKNVLYSACALIVTFLSVAAIYVLSGAEFIAITQIMIYVGGIVVLMVFGIMLTNKFSGKALVTSSHNKFWGYLVGATIFSLLLYAILKINQPMVEQLHPAANNIAQLGVGIMSDYILPFEMAAVFLLLALVGASSIASNNKMEEEQ